MSDLLLSRTFDPADLPLLAEESALLDGYATTGLPPHRRWEYALALHAAARWERAQPPPFQGATCAYDITRGRTGTDGNGGSRESLFHLMLLEWLDCETDRLVVEPGGEPLQSWCDGGVPLANVVTCLSMIDQVGDLDRALYHLSCLVAPGGLLILTMPYWNRCGPDTAVGCDQRLRIFCPRTYQQLRATTTALFLTTFGGVDPAYHGAQIHDYSLASLVLEKRR